MFTPPHKKCVKKHRPKINLTDTENLEFPIWKQSGRKKRNKEKRSTMSVRRLGDRKHTQIKDSIWHIPGHTSSISHTSISPRVDENRRSLPWKITRPGFRYHFPRPPGDFLRGNFRTRHKRTRDPLKKELGRIPFTKKNSVSSRIPRNPCSKCSPSVADNSAS